MSDPPFCPNAHCPHHERAPVGQSWFEYAGFYGTKAFGAVQRFRCLTCGKNFSTQTFRLDYYVKRPRSYRRILKRITAGSGVRSLGRDLKVSHQAVLNRLSRLARQALGVQAQLMSTLTLQEDLAADGFESFSSSQYEPNNIHLLVGCDSQCLYAFDAAHLRRKGRMTAAQKEERERREEQAIRERVPIGTSFAQLLEPMLELLGSSSQDQVRLLTDKKQEYATVIGEHPKLQPLIEAGRFTHVQYSSRIARTTTNPLFAVNYLDRQIRKDNANHVRETVQFSRNLNSQLERVAIYQLVHNCLKPYRVDHPKKRKLRHAEVAGVSREAIKQQLSDVFERRRFLTHLKLSWSQLLVWMRMVGNIERHTGGYWPAYVWM